MKRLVMACASIAIMMTAGIALVAASVWVGQYLRSDTFRKLLGAKTGEALGCNVAYGPLRWMGSSLFVDSIEVIGLQGSEVEKLRADQVRADVNWRAAINRVWRVDRVQVPSLEGSFRRGSIEPKAADALPPVARGGLASWLPTRFEVGQVDIAKARIQFRDINDLELASLRGSALRVQSDGAGWTIDGTGGVLSLAEIPVLTVVCFRSMAGGGVFFLTDSQFRVGETGMISASGEFAKNSKLRVEWSQVDVTPFLAASWRSHLTGVLAGAATIVSIKTHESIK